MTMQPTCTLREGMLKAAAFIEKHPTQYNFMEASVPANQKCGTTGCLLGWTAFFMGIPSGKGIWQEQSNKELGLPPSEVFMKRLGRISKKDVDAGIGQDNAQAGARLLRAYVKKHLPLRKKKRVKKAKA